MDIGHGTGSFAYATAEALMAAGRGPDVISTDLHQLSDQRPGLRPADDDEQVPPPRHVAAGRRARDDVAPGRDPRPRRRGRDAAARLARRRRALPPAARAFPLYDIWGEMREARRAAREHAHDRRRPAARAAAAAGRRRRGRETRSGPALQKPFTGPAAGRCATAATRRRRCARPPRPRLDASATGRGRARDRPAAERRAALDDRHGAREVDRRADVVRDDRDAVADRAPPRPAAR